MTSKLAVRLFLHRPDGQLLVVNRRQDPNLLCMPGGKVDPGESLSEAVVREMSEETGVRVPTSALQVLFSGSVHNDTATDKAPYQVTTFHAAWQPAFGEPTALEPGIVPRWVTPATFAQRCAAPAYDHAVVEAWQDQRRPTPRRRLR